MTIEPRLLVSLHDVTPVHARRLERAERLLEALGVEAVTYLLVPDFHGLGAAHALMEFVAWCRAPRPYVVQWFLHGYFHGEHVVPAVGGPRLTASEWLASSFLTAGEAECLGLRGEALHARLRNGIESCELCIGAPPTGFVAPAWLFNQELVPALTAMNFEYTESQLRVWQLRTGRVRRSPVITWATRTALRRWGSVACSAVRRHTRHPVVRVALHPFDFDHPGTIASIARTIDALRGNRTIAPYDDALFDAR
jgi:predicted deacetylase